ncbi:unnamed protein product, partial [Prorocentrum cordatum]
MVPAPWTWSGKQQQESKQDWMCKFCTFRRTGAPLISNGINEKCYKCKLHKGVAFKCVVPSDSPSRTKRKADGTIFAAAASYAKLEKRLHQLEAENAKLRGSPDSGGGDAAEEHNESEELRDEIDGLSKHVQWLESVRSPWAELPLKAAREQLEGARRKLYENKPLPAKLTALSRRAEQARIRYQKAEQDKVAADQKLLKAQEEAKAAAQVVLERQKVCLQLEEEVRALASSQPADEPGQHQAMDLAGPEIKLDEAKVLSALGAMEGAGDASKLAPKLAEVLKSWAAELLEEPPDKRARGAASGGQPAEPPPAAWDIDTIEVELLRKDVGTLADEGEGLQFPDYSCLDLCEYLNGEEGNTLFHLAQAYHMSPFLLMIWSCSVEVQLTQRLASFRSSASQQVSRSDAVKLGLVLEAIGWSRLKFQRAAFGDMQILFVSVYGEVGVGLKGNVELLGGPAVSLRNGVVMSVMAGCWRSGRRRPAARVALPALAALAAVATCAAAFASLGRAGLRAPTPARGQRPHARAPPPSARRRAEADDKESRPGDGKFYQLGGDAANPEVVPAAFGPFGIIVGGWTDDELEYTVAPTLEDSAGPGVHIPVRVLARKDVDLTLEEVLGSMDSMDAVMPDEGDDIVLS